MHVSIIQRSYSETVQTNLYLLNACVPADYPHHLKMIIHIIYLKWRNQVITDWKYICITHLLVCNSGCDFGRFGRRLERIIKWLKKQKLYFYDKKFTNLLFIYTCHFFNVTLNGSCQFNMLVIHLWLFFEKVQKKKEIKPDVSVNILFSRFPFSFSLSNNDIKLHWHNMGHIMASHVDKAPLCTHTRL